MENETVKVICCFCGESLNSLKAVEINIKVENQRDEYQTVYSHSECINSQLHPSIPRYFEDR